jgi:hypothetical protein
LFRHPDSIKLQEPSYDNLQTLEKQIRQQYFPSYQAAQQLGISSHLLSRITGTMFVLKGPKEAELEHSGKVNIGLNLKNNKREEEVCGYTRKRKDNNWLYSRKSIEALRNYMSEFPEVFEYLSTNERVSSDYFHASDIFFLAEDPQERLKALADWLKEQPFASASRQPVGTLTLDESLVTAIEREVTLLKETDPVKKKIVMQLKPHLIFKPSLFKGSGAPDQDAHFSLFDRVVNVREGFSVPMGLRGTVIGIMKATRVEDSLIEVVFDEEFHGGLSIRSTLGKAYRVPRAALINISHGVRKCSQASRAPKSVAKPMAIVQPIDQRSWTAAFSNRSSKEPSPAAAVKHVMPPDPKLLPMPTDFLQNSDSFQRGNPSPPKQQPSFDMNQLWQSLQQSQGQPPPPTMPELNSSVQQFFACAQSQQQAAPSTMPAFVPLQVQVKKSRPPKPSRGHHQESGREEYEAPNPPSQSFGQRGSNRGYRGRGGGGSRRPPRPQGAGRGTKIAANFGSS